MTDHYRTTLRIGGYMTTNNQVRVRGLGRATDDARKSKVDVVELRRPRVPIT
jgi:hypothetical protein